MHQIFKETPKGIEVWPTVRTRLPGIYQNMFQAERGLEKYKNSYKNVTTRPQQQRKKKGVTDAKT